MEKEAGDAGRAAAAGGDAAIEPQQGWAQQGRWGDAAKSAVKQRSGQLRLALTLVVGCQGEPALSDEAL